MKTAFLFAAAGFAAVQLSAADVDWSKLPPASTEAGITFDKDIAPMLKVSCVRCHGAERPRAQLRLDSLDGVLKGTKDGPILTAGDSANSQLVKAVSQLDPKIAMPPKPRPRRNPAGGPMGTNAPAAQPPGEAPGAATPPPPAGGDQPPAGPPPDGGPGGPPPGGPGAGGPPPRMMAKPLTAEQVGLIRAWIDQGAK